MAKLTIAGIEYEGTPEEIREMVEAVNAIAEAEGTVVEEVDEFAKFTKGSTVRLISGGGGYPLTGFDDGKEYVVDVNDFQHDGGRKIRILRDGHPNQGFALPEQLELVAKEAPQEALKVGDKVEVIDGSKSRWGDLGTGTIGEITDIDEDYTEPYRVDTEDDYDRFPADVLRKVEEKPREYRYGDIVKGYGIHVDHEVIGIVEDVGTSMLGVNFNGNRYTAIEDFELIAPVESRVDTK